MYQKGLLKQIYTAPNGEIYNIYLFNDQYDAYSKTTGKLVDYDTSLEGVLRRLDEVE